MMNWCHPSSLHPNELKWAVPFGAFGHETAKLSEVLFPQHWHCTPPWRNNPKSQRETGTWCHRWEHGALGFAEGKAMEGFKVFFEQSGEWCFLLPQGPIYAWSNQICLPARYMIPKPLVLPPKALAMPFISMEIMEVEHLLYKQEPS